MKKLFIIALALSFFTSCKKDDAGTPSTPQPQPADDVRTVLLKEVIEQGMPDPFYKFVYDTAKYVTEINFADGLAIYTVEYENKRVKKMTNIRNLNYMEYSYTNGLVTRINEFNAAHTKVQEYDLLYNANRKLVQVTWKEYFSSPAGTIYKKEKMVYQADGNLASIEIYVLTNGVLGLSSTRLFSDYDNQTNVDDFYKIDDFFDSFLFLPQVRFQLNNPRKEKIAGGANDFDITYTYQFSNNLPVSKSGVMIQTRGNGNGQPFHFTNRFTYY